MNVVLVRASESDQTTLANLLHLYVHDFSEFLGTTPSERGLFSYPQLSRYFRDPGRSAFLIRAVDALVGFALTSTGSLVTGDPEVSDLAEFFVVRGVRRRGVGRAAAHSLFRTVPGVWEVRVNELNRAAQRFWQRVIEQYAGSGFEVEPWIREDGSEWRVFRFRSSEGDV